jgi:hypothetical protein
LSNVISGFGKFSLIPALEVSPRVDAAVAHSFTSATMRLEESRELLPLRYPIFVAVNQRLRRTIMNENAGGAGRFAGASAMGDRAEADKSAAACDPQ